MVKALHHALCASQWAGESRFKPPGCASDCGDGSYFTPGGNCTRYSVSPSSSARFVLLHTVGSFAYNPGVLARVARAHAQLAKTAHRYAIVQVSRAPPPSAPCRFYEPGYYDPQPNCSASRYAIGQEDARAHEALVGATHASVVHRVSEAVVQRTLGHLLLRKMGRIRWSDRRAPHWLSAGCDLPGIVWFAQMRSAGRLDPSLQHVWVVQHDVGWTGELPAILQRFDAGPDLLCDGLGRPPPDWPHAREHNHLPRDGVYGCLLPATRYSARLLDDQVDALRAGNVSYCEIRAASACAHASWPCKAAGLRGRGLLGPFSAYTSIDERALFAAAGNRTGAAHGQGSRLPERCGKRADGAQVGRLYHRVYNVVGEKRRSRFADCPDVCYTDWPRPGRSPPPPPSSSGGAPPAVSTHRAHHGAASARHTSRQQGKPAKVLRAGARAI